jgi:hypothetical protein
MPIVPPALDDRRFDDLVEELLARIPAHTPEWTNPRPGDPGRTLIDLFAWLGETLLYRANLIPERQRLAFLQLLGSAMRPALPARGLVMVAIDDETSSTPIYMRPLATISKPLPFETLGELTVLPVIAECYYKRRLSDDERQDMDDVIVALQQIYNLRNRPTPYTTTAVFVGGNAEPTGFDLARSAVDKCLWFALLAPKPELTPAALRALGANANGGQQLLNVGVMPAIAIPDDLDEQVARRTSLPHVWEISTPTPGLYLGCDVIADSSAGLSRRGVLRLALPGGDKIGAPDDDVRRSLQAGVGDQPPRLDDPKKAARLVAWLRLRPSAQLDSFALSWAGVNAVEVDQRQTITGRVVGVSDGASSQIFQLPGVAVDPATLQLQVEESGLGYQLWSQTNDLATAGRDDSVYEIDGEAGTIRFGDGVRGRVPEADMRIRVALMRAGGGAAGNLPAGQLANISARDLAGAQIVTKLKVFQPLSTEGGRDTETLAEAEQRIPALFRHRERAVIEDDYRRLASEAPGVRVGRVEILPRFKPQQRRSEVPGVVSVMVLPYQPPAEPPCPRTDRLLIEAVYAHLDARRPIGTELYVIGCEYVPLALSVGVIIGDGLAPTFGDSTGLSNLGTAAARDGVLRAIREALRRYLWPLSPGGPAATGWPLGRTVGERELEVAVARVAGVSGVLGINLFRRRNNGWELVGPARGSGTAEIRLERWQLPELLSVVVVANQSPPSSPDGLPNPFAVESLAVPVVPKLC